MKKNQTCLPTLGEVASSEFIEFSSSTKAMLRFDPARSDLVSNVVVSSPVYGQLSLSFFFLNDLRFRGFLLPWISSPVPSDPSDGELLRTASHKCKK